MRSRFFAFILVFQSLLILLHWFVCQTWIYFQQITDSHTIFVLRLVLLLLSLTFVAASLLAWRSFAWPLRLFYKISAVWLGAFSFFVLAACFTWIAYVVALVAEHVEKPVLADAVFGLALLAAVAGIVNANLVRVTRLTLNLPGLPETWRGRAAALVSDTHLGHVHDVPFMREIVRKLNQLRPDVVFITGDMYDGTTGPLDRLAEPWKELTAPHGAYFITGNHEGFTDRRKYLDAVARSGVHVLNNEKIEIEGLQLVGVHDRESNDPARFASILESAPIDPARASILLMHAPHHLHVSEAAGISLQLSGHTHGGQFWPFTWITHRIYGAYVHGLNRFGKMLVFTTWGAGTWGPPLRLGTNPEIVLIRFE
ncbi:MAG TPA: metallophosphoesterase [Candidatus Acidoferrales bacterium]